MCLARACTACGSGSFFDQTCAVPSYGFLISHGLTKIWIPLVCEAPDRL
ncbi:hypothetical protein PhaeoP83_02354 [Phaeobacter inhibens]|uniref:Uncharacterized protein n=1 Tax=Phaeobacter inhibens TaxID=221822 RepID=A0ABM6RFJ4_9RHOB|nr:hypothetical protein PhaeoP83_02354 [Phaeobacter inhibens]AUQ95158.1 hypothetical protein PhaeoP66_02386 [Phaeobacter inhibens]AUR20423.1 hypothetical protein PhaeoP80_02354 [Phaeobacter inhibens]